jgi:hypothetical protein
MNRKYIRKFMTAILGMLLVFAVGTEVIPASQSTEEIDSANRYAAYGETLQYASSSGKDLSAGDDTDIAYLRQEYTELLKSYNTYRIQSRCVEAVLIVLLVLSIFVIISMVQREKRNRRKNRRRRKRSESSSRKTSAGGRTADHVDIYDLNDD